MADEFAHAVQALRPQLLRFAQAQLRNEAWAEDAVSETVLAALAKPQAFAGQSQLKTWLVGILKHKLVDQMRRTSREVSIEPLDEQSLDEALDALFNETGHWCDKPVPWVEPERAVEQAQLMKALERCLENLPARLARVLMMREWLEKETQEVCDELGITANNCHVMLFRARMLMRACLDTHWFQRTPTR